MNRENLLKEIRDDLTNVILRLTPENYLECFEEIKNYGVLLKWLRENLPKEPEIAEDISLGSASQLPREIYDNDNNLYIGMFNRKLVGGEFGSFAIFVPEKIVRDLEIEDGDWVKARIKNSYKALNGVVKNTYNFEVIRRAEEKHETTRREMKFAIVQWEKDLKEYYIVDPEESGLKTKILISNRTVENMHLEEGDVVDYAYYEGEKLSGRVVWKHPTDYDEKSAPKPKSFYKVSDSNSENTEDMEPVLEGQIIAVVGYESMKTAFEEVVVDRKGEFLFLSGDETPIALESNLREVSRIILFPEFVSHGAMFTIKDIAKQYEIPISYPKKIGKSGFARLLEGLSYDEELEKEDDDYSEEVSDFEDYDY